MNRIRDYIGFAIWFAGLGYVALWPVTSPDSDGRPFGASIICHDVSLSVLDLLCNSAHPLQLPPNLHALGLMSALIVALRLLYFAFRRSRRVVVAPTIDISALLAQLPQMMPAPRRRKPVRPLRPIKPRAHFGLRGTPR